MLWAGQAFLNWLLVKPERCLQIVFWRFGAKKKQVTTLLGMETLERGDTTISDKEVFPQGSHPWNTWRSIILLCFNTSAGRVPRGKECAKPPEKWWMSVQMQRPSKGPGEKEGKSMYTKEQSLNTRWQWQVSSSKADQHHPSYQQKKNSLQKSQHQSRAPSGQRRLPKHVFKAKTLVPIPVFVSKGCSMCGSVYHAQGRALPKLHAQAGAIPK